MKSNVIFFLLGLSLFVIMSFQDTSSVKQNQVVDFRDARVNLDRGIALFVRCEPVKPYKYLGTLKVGIVMHGWTSEMIKVATRKAAEKYPDGNGIIFTAEDLETFDVVKFE
jgi:hypothetical protein